jgi:hypothetical protein
MQRPAVRWSVLAVALAVAAGLVYRAATLEQRSIDRRRALVAATSDARALRSALADARRALSAMAAPGQAAVSWSRQATASIETARTKFTALAAVEGGPAAATSLERLDKLVEAEARLRENAVGGRALMASDVAFGEALPHVDALDQQAADAAAAMTAAADRAIAVYRDSQLAAAAGAVGLLAAVALILAPAPRPAPAPAIATAASAVGSTAEAAADLNELPLAAEPPHPAPAMPPPMVEAPDLTPLAAACDALARLADGDALPTALEAARPALDARGVAVWLADVDRRRLHVVAAAGYDARVVERFPTIDRQDRNPTSRAYASGEPATMPASGGQPAAVAVPIAGARGTTGVLSAELVDGATAGPEILARARIIAAQLAGLLEPPAAAAPAAADSPVARAENA